MYTNVQSSGKKEKSDLNLKEEIDYILNGADLTKYATGIVKLILAEKYDLNVKERKVEIETIVSDWLKDKEYRINIEHGYLEDILKQQVKMKKQLDNLTADNDLLRQIRFKLYQLNGKVNRMMHPRELRPSHCRYKGYQRCDTSQMIRFPRPFFKAENSLGEPSQYIGPERQRVDDSGNQESALHRLKELRYQLYSCKTNRLSIINKLGHEEEQQSVEKNIDLIQQEIEEIKKKHKLT